MQNMRMPEQEAAEDIFFGQAVMIWARWFVILAGALIALWAAESIAELALAIGFVVVLMGINFFVHGRYLMERPANRSLLLLVAVVDTAIITLIVLAWQGRTGMESPFFIFYYPMVLAFAFVFPPAMAAGYTLVVIAAYLGANFLTDPGILISSRSLEALTMRLITLAAMGALGAYYWRVQRNRRRLAAEGSAERVELSASAN